MTRRTIDRDTVQPNGKRGETQRPAFTKINDNFAEIYAGLDDAQSALMHLDDTTVRLLPRCQNLKSPLISRFRPFCLRRRSCTVVSSSSRSV